MGQVYNLTLPCTSTPPQQMRAISHKRLMRAIGVYKATVPYSGDTINATIYSLIDRYFHSIVGLDETETDYLYRAIAQQLTLETMASLAEDYVEDLAISPFQRFKEFSYAQWCESASYEQLQTIPSIFEIVQRGRLFAESPEEDVTFDKALRYITAAFVEKGIPPEVAADRIHTITHGSRLDAIASGLKYD